MLSLSVIAASVEASERYLAGVMPVLFLNAVQKTLSQEKPVRKQISLTDNVVHLMDIGIVRQHIGR